jgi:hypothetical protein
MKYLIGLCILTCSVVPGFGTTISFGSPTGDQGVSNSYGGITATAYGALSATGAPPHLFGKMDGGDENGVGLTTDPSGEHEITSGDFIQLDLSGITGPVTITMGSTTSPDAYEIFGSSSATNTTIANVLETCNSATTSCESSFTITPTLRYLDFTATDGNVLLSSISYTQSTPEPGTLGIVGLGGVLICLLRRKLNQN